MTSGIEWAVKTTRVFDWSSIWSRLFWSCEAKPPTKPGWSKKCRILSITGAVSPTAARAALTSSTYWRHEEYEP